jgi:hypothetical protein
MCAKNNIFEFLLPLRGRIPLWVVDMCISKRSFWLGGFLAGLPLFVEERRRRAELAMYVMPKALESAWKVARGKGYLPGSEATRRSGLGETLLTAIGMAMVMVRSAYCPANSLSHADLLIEYLPDGTTTSLWSCKTDFVSVRRTKLRVIVQTIGAYMSYP